jgi:glycosyltransferase involved in cell wall biosynthesis
MTLTAPHLAEALHLAAPAVMARTFDGIICFGGEDWWYHNRGHYDMQMMRELSRHIPVLYVNSIGMRMPRPAEGRMFLRRILRKVGSLRRGCVQVRENFAVYSPVVAPGRRGMALSRRLLPLQIRRAGRRAGIRHPLLWVACPPAAEAVDALQPVGVVYQRTDRFEAFRGVDPARIAGYDRQLKSRADLTLFCSRLLCEEEGDGCRRALYIDHGVDFDRFADAARRAQEPEDVRAIPRPRAGFIGGIDAHTFDPPLLLEVARQLPDVHFVMVGACSLPPDWCTLPNVHLLGQRPYEQVAAYMAACDVLIMPWNQSDWIRACNPVKLKEYLAVGRPVVTASFDELRSYAGLGQGIRIARGAPEFAAAINAALADDVDSLALQRRVQDETWTAKAGQVVQRLQQLGLHARSGTAEGIVR